MSTIARRTGLLCLVAIASIFTNGFAISEEVGKTFPLARKQLDGQARGATTFYKIGDPLYTELGRQAFLITAREDFGLKTLDGSLFEEVDREDPNAVDVSLSVVADLGVDVKITRGNELLWEHHLADQSGPVSTYLAICRNIEPITHHEFVEILKKLGYTHQPNKRVESARLTEEQESLLLSMNHIAQWMALRSIHTDIREEGESPERLGGLVRGYSNLAQLTLPLVDLRHQVYRARAMLYAERLYNFDQSKQIGIWNQQYCMTMCGLIKTSNNRFLWAEKKKARGESPATNETPPDWLPLLKHYGEYKYEALETIAFDEKENPLQELAQTLWYRAIEQSNCKMLINQAGNRIQAVNYEGLWVNDSEYYHSGVGKRHEVTANAPTLHTRQMRNWLLKLEDIPKEITKRLGRSEDPLVPKSIAMLANKIIAADQGELKEPSLANLGRTIEGWNVLHLYRRTHFLKYSLGAESYDEILPQRIVYKNHPHGRLIESYALPRNAKFEDYEALLSDYEFIDGSRRTHYELVNRTPKDLAFANTTRKEARRLLWIATSDNEADISQSMYVANSHNAEDMLYYAGKLGKISKHSPIRHSILLRHKWQKMKRNLDKHLRDYGHYPAVQRSVAEGFTKDDNHEKAIEHFEKYIESSPDQSAIQSLAQIYYDQGTDEWLDTLAITLDQPDFGLTHAAAASRIAATLMHEGRFDEAMPWAERAGISGSAWGMLIHAECLTTLGKLEEAERIVRYVDSRYSHDGYSRWWYFWAAENQSANYDEVWEEYQQQIDEGFGPKHMTTLFTNARHAILIDDYEQALEHWQAYHDHVAGYWPMIHLFLCLDHLEMPEERDELLIKILDREKTENVPRPYYKTLKHFQSVLNGEDFSAETIQKIIEFEEKQNIEGWDVAISFITATFLENRGNLELANEYWKVPARMDTQDWQRLVAWVKLRNQGIEPATLKGRNFERQLDPTKREAKLSK